MKKVKVKKGLSLNKETVTKLNNNQMSFVKGGAEEPGGGVIPLTYYNGCRYSELVLGCATAACEEEESW